LGREVIEGAETGHGRDAAENCAGVLPHPLK
jgi:hypothetical protein